jgi:hypothetical protein
MSAYWPLNEGTGTFINDLSGNRANGDVVSPAWSDTTRGKSLNFGGEDSGRGAYVSNTSVGSMGTGDFTVSAWFNKTATHTSWFGTLVSPGDGSGVPKWEENWALIILGDLQGGEAGKLEFIVGKGTGNGYSGARSTNADHVDGNWHHVVGVADRSGSVHLYIDGVWNASKNFVINQSLSSGSGLAIGTTNSSIKATTFSFDGDIQHICIWKRLFTTMEVKTLYAQQKPVFNLLSKTHRIRNKKR